jgi:hypothetical protein
MLDKLQPEIHEDRDLTLSRLNVEDKETWHTWADSIPYFIPRSGWEIAVIPPFGGPMARFMVKYRGYRVSVFLDVYGRLNRPRRGEKPKPHWEVYPASGRDVVHVDMDDVDRLTAEIDASFLQQQQVALDQLDPDFVVSLFEKTDRREADEEWDDEQDRPTEYERHVIDGYVLVKYKYDDYDFEPYSITRDGKTIALWETWTGLKVDKRIQNWRGVCT